MGGGAGGAYTTSTISVTPGTTYTVTVGTAVTATTSTTDNTVVNGNPSWFSSASTIYAEGGAGGVSRYITTNITANGAGGVGSSAASIGTTKFTGGSGGTPPASTSSVPGGGGGSSAGTASNGNAGTSAGAAGAAVAGGGAGSAGSNIANASAGSVPGGGGGGARSNGTTLYTGGKGAAGQVAITYTQLTYKSQINSINFGISPWCAGETRSVTVSVTNTGTATWTDANPDINIGLKWDEDPDFGSPPGNIGRQDAGNLAPGATRVYTFPIVTPVIASGTDHLNVDVVYEGVAWFRSNSPTGIGPGNPNMGGGTTQYISSAITIAAIPAIPTGTASQSFCTINNPTVANLTATYTAGNTLKWYATSTGGTALVNTTSLVNGTTYYATQTSTSGCESTGRFAVSVTVGNPVAPTGAASQPFCTINNPTVASINVTGTAIKWYTVSTGGTAIANTTPLVNGTTYYASQTASGCESATRLAVSVTVGNPAAPTGAASQPFCTINNPTIVNINVTGTAIKWYTVSTGGTVIANTTPLVNGTTYYASQTVSGCESATRLAVTVTVGNPAAPTGAASQTFCTINNPTVANLNATGTAIQWYSTSTGGTALSGTTALSTGTYYASQTVSGCESATRLAITVTVGNPAAPTGSASQSFCTIDNPTVANLNATGTAIQWYSTSTGGTALSGTTALSTGTYYASQTVSGCESAIRLAITVTVGNPAAPTGSASQSFCTIDNPTVANLSATGTAIQWYSTSTGGTALSGTTALSTGTYYASQILSGCESAIRLTVSVTVGNPAAPTGSVSQTFCSDVNPTVADLIASGTGIQWYTAPTGGTALATTTTLLNGTHYYASQTDGSTSCESSTRLDVTVTVNQAPSITIDPSPATQTVCATANMSYFVTATGTGLTYQWYRGTTALVDVGRISGATTSTLTITGVTAADGGDYTVIVSGTSPCSPATSAIAHLDINQSIVFSVQPLTPQTICQGSAYSIFAQATGATGIGATYEWFHNGVFYATGTFDGVDKYSLTIPAVTPADAGSYRLYLDDGSGTTCSKANSNIATLNVSVTSVGGSVSSDATVCSGTNGGTLTLNGQTGNIVRWESSTDGGTTWAPITNTTTAQTYTNLTQTTQYRAVVQSGVCPSDNSAAATITVNPIPDAVATPSSQPVCSGTAITTIALTGSVTGTTFAWTRDNTASVTGIAASGNGDISGTLTNSTNAPITVTFTITSTANTCVGSAITATVTVNPVPTLSSTLTPPARCSNTSGTYTATSAVTSTTYTWTRAAVTGISNAAGSGSGAALTETLVNTTTDPVNVIYAITLTANGCNNTQNVTVNVNPTPVLSSILTPAARCSNTPGTYTSTSATTGTTYAWSRAVIAGISNAAGSGSGAVITETLVNTTANPVNVVYAVTLTANGCSNTQNVVVTVNPSPTLSSGLTPAAICNNTVFSYSPTSATTGTTFDWSRAAVAGISNAAATGTNNPNETLINTTPNSVNVVYAYTLTANGCTNTQNVTVTVKPTPTLSSTLTPPARCSNVSTTYTATSATTGTTYTWSRAAVTGITPATGTGGSATITETLVNSTANPITVTYVIILTANGCSNTQNVTAVVNPSPTLSSSLTPPAICNNTVFSYTPTSNTTGVTFNWSRATVVGISNAAATGTNNPNETLINTTANPVNVTYVYTLGANGCSNTQNVVVTVNPSPTLSSGLTPAAICNNTVFSYSPTSATTGTTFDWSRAAVAGISNAAATGTNNPNETLINTTPNSVNVVYAYTLTANGCTNTQNVTVTVKPTPTLSSTLTPPARCSNVSTTYTATSATTGTTYTWSRAAVTGITPATGTGGSATITETLVNSTANPITVTYVIILTANGCSNTQNVTAVVNPSPTLSSSLTPPAICNNTVFSYTPTSNTTGVTFNWSRATVVGISNAAATGTNNPNETLINTTANPVNVTYVYTLGANGCSNTQNVVVTVNPTPTLSSSLTSAARCSNTSGTYTATSATLGTTYTWTRAAVTGISNPASSGSGAAITETLINTTTDPVSVVYVITLTANGCTNIQNVTVVINPTPVLTSSLTAPVRCSNVSTTYTATSATSGVTYTWSRAAVAGITPNTGSGGSANIIETLINSTANPVTVTYAVTITANGCSNTQNVTAVVNPSPSLSSSSTQNRCDNVSTTYTATSATTGTTFTWTRAAVAGISNTAASGSSAAITETLDNTTANPINIIYAITLSANGCSNAQNVTVTVNPTPVLTSTLTPPARCSNTSGTYTATSATTAATYAWSRAAVAGISNAAASGSGATITETLINTTISPVNVIYAVTLTINGCTNTQNVTLTINPLPTITPVASAAPKCFSAIAQTTTLAYSNATSNPTTYSINYNAAANTAGFVDVTDAALPASPIIINIAAGTAVGTYTGSITVKNANGCTSGSATSFTVTINALPTPSLTNSPASPVCANTNVTYTTDAGQSNYVWTFSGTAGTDYTIVSGGNSTSNTAIISWKTSTPATKTVTVNYSNSNGCTAVTPTSKNITVLSVPTGNITVTENSGITANDNVICAGDAVTFTAPSGYGSYTWYVNGTKVQGPNTDNTYSTTTLTTGQTVTVDIANANNCGATFTAPAVTVSPLPMPTLAVTESSGTANDNIICPNASVTLTATGGSTYSFLINGTAVATGTSNTYVTTAITATSTVAVTVTNANGCQATSANQTVTVVSVPSGTLTVSPGNSFCIGTSVTFTAAATAPTTGYTYNFKVNGVSKQNNATNTYITNTLTNGQVVTVDVINSNGCITTFNPIAVTVNPLPTGTLTATENSGVQNDNNICAGSPVTFTATSGYSNYAFYLKGTGTALYNGSSNVYTTSTLVTGDYLTVVVTSGSSCTATFTSATITVVASPTGTLTETDNSGTALNDNIICAGDNVTFTATAGFANYNFQVNGATVQNGAGNTFSSTSLANGDVVTVDVTNTNSCVTTFNAITMVVNPLPAGTLAIAENAGTPNDGIICTGTSVTFTAPNGFTNYNFLLNGVSVQSGALKTYTTTTLANGDKVTVAITGTGGCIGLLNQYTITVNPLPTVAPITTTAPSFDVCVGSTIILQDATSPGVWSSESPGIATVNASTGVVAGVAAGTAVIDYTYTNSNGCSSTVTATITVHALPTVQPITGNFNICTGTSSLLSDVTSGGTWSTSDASIATVDASGNVTGVSQGTATISYTVTDTYSCPTTVTADVTVSDFPAVAAITTTSPSSFNVCIGNTIQLKDATTGGTWSIVNGSGTATISSAGVVTGTSAGTVTAYYSINASCGLPASSSQVINVNAPPSANIFYTGSPFCTTSSPVSVTQTGTTGGTYSSASGLTINNSNGTITPASSTAGTYTVTYTIPASATGGCGVYTATTSVTITAAPSATIAYSASPYCSNGGTATVTRTGTAGGTYTKTAGAGTLSINASTGDITLGTSTPGTYTVTYTVAASGGCSLFSTTASVTITAAPSATIAYSASPYCSNGGTATVTQTGTSGGTYTKTSGAGTLSLNSATGAITLGTSTPGTYTVTYTVAASAGCAIFTTTASVTITAAPTAVAGTAVITCSNNPPVNITAGSSATNYSTIVWTSSGTGTFANQGSLTATTYAPSAADITAGSVTLTLKANGNGGCAAATSTKTLTISAPPPAFVITPSGTINVCQGSVQPITATVNASSTSSTTVSSGNINLSIPDALDFFFFIVPGSVTNNLNVTTVPAGAIINSVSVNFNITHTYDGDLVLNLRAPNGKVLNLVDQKGKGGKNFTNTTVSSISTNPFLNGAANAPFTGTFVADGDNGVGTPLSGNTVFYDLFSVPNGTWTFGAEDDGPADVGKILNWSITFNYTIPGTPLSTIWSPTTDLYTDPGATTAYTGTALSTVYAKPASSGTKVYTATVTNAASCSTSQNVTLNVGAAPVVTVTADYCAVAGKVKLTANSTPAATSYLWSTGETTQSILVDVSGIYSVTVYAAGSTCPGKGTINVANELITNGNFEAGNVAFTSSYPYRTGAGSLNNPPGYAVDTAANYYGPTFLWGKDHTTGHGKFMMVNGAAGANYQIWQQTISVLPNTTYYFSAWGLELDNLPTTLQDGAPANAQLQFNVNGTQTGTLGNLPRPNNPQTDADNNQWVRFYGSWTSGPTTTSAVVSITDLQGAVYGNNFGLDDISFGTLSTFVELQSAVGTDAQTVCVNNPIANIIYSAGSSASAPTITALPNGVTSSWNGVYLTISGTPTVAGNYSYTITTTGSCQPATATGTITVQAQKIALSSGNSSPSVCANTAMSNIVFTLSGTATNATTTGLPAGVTGTKSGSGPTYIYTLSGTPTATPGSYPYTITTSGTCSPVTFNGTITITSQSITLNSANNTQTVCINAPIANIQYTVAGTGTNASVIGLPSGVAGTYNSGLFVISGSPTSAAGSPYTYTVTTSGTSCAIATATGTITVTPAASFTLTSGGATNPQTVCKGSAITNITYSVTNATGASATGLPAGVTGAFSGGVFTISGTPTAAAGTYNYIVTSSGGCAVGTITGSITVQAQTISLTSGTASPSVCANTPITNIVYTIGGTATGASVTGLPTGLSGTLSGNTFTINGTPTAASGPYPYTVTTSGTCSVVTATGTINILPAPVGGTVASIATICSGQNGSLTLSGNTGSVMRWEFSTDGGTTWTPTAPANTTITQSFTNITVPTQYRAVVGNNCSNVFSSVATIAIHNYWTGLSSSDWQTASNWSDNQVASNSCSMYMIPGSTPNQPQLTLSNTTVSNITIAPGASLDLNGKTFTVTGAFSGTGTLIGNASSALIINSGNGNNAGTVYFKKGRPFNQLKTLKISSGTLTLGGNITNGDTLNIVGGNSSGYGSVNVDGVLNTGGLLALLSDAQGTAQVGISHGVINDTVTVQRYFPAIRAWRFVGIPFGTSNQTINKAWQEGNIDTVLSCPPQHPGTAGYGTAIAFNNDYTAGFDAHNNNYKTSLEFYNSVTNMWQTPPTLPTKITDYNAYSLFVRGDRTVCLTTTSPAMVTTLRPRGILNQLNNGADLKQNFLAGPANGYVLIGNSYASAIDITNIISSSGSSGILPDRFLAWNPRQGGSLGVGGYVTYQSGVQVPGGDITYTAGTKIQSGQGFMVQRGSAGNAGFVTFHENDKINNYQDVSVFGLRAAPLTQTPSVIYANLIDTTGAVMDGVAGAFSNGYSAAVDSVDATKRWNEEIENMALIRHDTALAIEFRPMPKSTDTLFFRLYLRQHPYRLKVFSQTLAPNFSGKAWIVDKYLGTETEINLRDTSVYNFTPNTDTNSYRNRFELVFSPVNSRLERLDSLISKIRSHIYPNPVSGRLFNLVLENAHTGVYSVNIFNVSGVIVATRTINYQTGRINYTIPLSASLASGSYTVQVLNSSGVIVSALPLIISR